MERCEQCGSKLRNAGTTTALGRRLCGSCGDALTGATIGTMHHDTGLAIALGRAKGPGEGGGILHWIRTALKGRRD